MLVFFKKFLNRNIRPTKDDLNLLKKELVQVQQLSDTVVREKEYDLKLLKKENSELQNKNDKFELFYLK